MEISDLLNKYADFIRQEITYTKIQNCYEITTPFLDIDNDYIQIYLQENNGALYLSDDAYTINNLESRGINLIGNKKKILYNLAKQFNITIKNDEFIVKTDTLNFPQDKHRFIQFILKAYDMSLYHSKEFVSSFSEEVANFFKEQEIYATENISLVGKSGLIYMYDFLFSRTKNKPERLCNIITSPNKSTISNTLFSWIDTKETRKSDSRLIILANDSNSKITNDLLTATNNYDVQLIEWSKRNLKENINLLVS